MKIVFDNIIFDLQQAGGISVYWQELLSRFGKTDNDIVWLERDAEHNRFRKMLNGGKVHQIKKMPKNLDRYFNLKTDFIGEKHLFHSSYYRTSKSKNAVNISTVHDFTYEKFSSGLKKWVHCKQKHAALRKSDLIICISENTKNDLFSYLPDIAKERVVVIRNGVSDKFFVEKQECSANPKINDLINKKYLLYIGARGGYKNFSLAVNALAQLENDYILVCVGSEWTDAETALNSPISDRIILISNPPIEDINILYNHAFCLLYPSLYEGFGIPVVEAMKCGCPVIAANCSSIPEIAGDAAILIDDISESSVLQAINSLQNEAFRNDYISKGIENSKRFSWQICFEQTKKEYEKLGRK